MPVTAMDRVAAAKQNMTEISVDTAKNKLSNMSVLDVRQPAEFSTGHLPGAINIPRGVLEFKITAHPEMQNKQDEDLVVYCQSASHSALDTVALNLLGYSKAVSMAGGVQSLVRHRL